MDAANLTPPTGMLERDAASILYIDEKGGRWRLPKGNPKMAQAAGAVRVAREISTERDFFHAEGTFYELPSNNAGGIALVRPVCTHNLPIRDFCSWRGFTVLSGLPEVALPAGEFIRSGDGKERLWLGASDDLWQFGKPFGEGGPWNQTAVKAGIPSDPYLFTGFDRKTLRLSHQGSATVDIRVEIDLTGMGLWVEYRTFPVPAGKPVTHQFPTGFNAYWLRAVASADATVTAMLRYS